MRVQCGVIYMAMYSCTRENDLSFLLRCLQFTAGLAGFRDCAHNNSSLLHTPLFIVSLLLCDALYPPPASLLPLMLLLLSTMASAPQPDCHRGLQPRRRLLSAPSMNSLCSPIAPVLQCSLDGGRLHTRSSCG